MSQDYKVKERISDFPEWMQDTLKEQAQALLQLEGTRDACNRIYREAIDRGASEAAALDEASAFVEENAIRIVARYYQTLKRPRFIIRVRNWFRRTFIKKYKYAYAYQKGDKQWRIFP